MSNENKPITWAKAQFGDQIAPNGKPVWENFVTWFDKSKVVDDETGAPLMVYHGTKGNFTTFKTPAWFTPDQALADNFSEYMDLNFIERTEESKVMSVYLRLKNPIETDDWLVTEPDEAMRAQYREWERQGHDGIIFSMDGEIEYVVFNPSQIKSARDNSGNFDPSSTCINDTDSHSLDQGHDNLVADNQGRAIVLYHGTRGQFSELAPGRAGGIYFTPRFSHAKRYGPNVIEAHLKIERLADLTNPESEAYHLAVEAFNAQGGWSSNEDAMGDRDRPYFDPEIDATWEIFDNPDTNVSGALRAAGYDGVRLQEYDNDVSYVVFEPKQIKPVTSDFELSSLDLSALKFDQVLERTHSDHQNRLTLKSR